MLEALRCGHLPVPELAVETFERRGKSSVRLLIHASQTGPPSLSTPRPSVEFSFLAFTVTHFAAKGAAGTTRDAHTRGREPSPPLRPRAVVRPAQGRHEMRRCER
jgi:hypothetical protein